MHYAGLQQTASESLTMHGAHSGTPYNGTPGVHDASGQKCIMYHCDNGAT